MEPDPKSAAWLREERGLIARAKAGDREAVARLYRAFAPRLYARVLVPRLGDRQAAEDALSETFRVALERLDRFEPRGASVYFWLARIAANRANDMHRVRGRTRRALASFEGLVAPLLEGERAPGEALEAVEEGRRLRAAVREVLGAIRPRYRRAIELRFFEERSRADCAAAMEVKLGTFDVVLLRALRAFRARWAEVVAAGEGARSP